MKFKVKANDIKKVAKNVGRATASRTTIDALTTFKLEANSEKQMIKLTAGNGEMFISEKIEAEVEESGKTLVPAKLFGEALSKLNGDIEVAHLNNSMQIKSGYSDMKLVTKNADEFPAMSAIESDAIDITIEKETILKAIDKTIFAVSSDIAKGVITGVLFEIKNGMLTSVGVDGFRMAVNSENVESQEDKRIVIQGKNLSEIAKVLKNTKGDSVSIKMDERNAKFEIDNVKIVTALLSGDFIEYNSLLPTDHSVVVTVNKEDLYNAVDRITLIATENRNSLAKFTIENGKMTVNSQSEEGSVSEDLDVETSGTDLVIGFNASYILDALKRIKEEKIILEFQSAVRPVYIRVPDDPNYRQIVLPVRIPN